MLVDVGSTTTDIIALIDGSPAATGRTDTDRLASDELVYMGVRRTPVCAIAGSDVAAELFATTRDVYLVLGKVVEDPAECDTADGRPATRANAHARLSRMKCGDPELMSSEATEAFAAELHERIVDRLNYAYTRVESTAQGHLRHRKRYPRRAIASGSGEFLARELLLKRGWHPNHITSLSDNLGGLVASCAPAYALAVLATERQNKAGEPGA